MGVTLPGVPGLRPERRPEHLATSSQRSATGRTARSTARSRSTPTPTATRRPPRRPSGTGRRGRGRRRGRSTSASRSTWRSSTPTSSPQLQLGPAAAGRRRRVGVQERRDDRQPAAQRAVPGPGRPATRAASTAPTLPPCFTGVSDLGRDRPAARSRPRHADVQPAARRLRAAARRRRSPRSPVRRPTRSRSTRCSPRATRSTIRTASTSSRCSTSTATRPPIAADNATRVVRRTTLAARLKAIYGIGGQPRRVHRHARGEAPRRLRARRAADTPSGGTSSPRCATATGSSTTTTRCRPICAPRTASTPAGRCHS